MNNEYREQLILDNLTLVLNTLVRMEANQRTTNLTLVDTLGETRQYLANLEGSIVGAVPTHVEEVPERKNTVPLRGKIADLLWRLALHTEPGASVKEMDKKSGLCYKLADDIIALCNGEGLTIGEQ